MPNINGKGPVNEHFAAQIKSLQTDVAKLKQGYTNLANFQSSLDTRIEALNSEVSAFQEIVRNQLAILGSQMDAASEMLEELSTEEEEEEEYEEEEEEEEVVKSKEELDLEHDLLDIGEVDISALLADLPLAGPETAEEGDVQ